MNPSDEKSPTRSSLSSSCPASSLHIDTFLSINEIHDDYFPTQPPRVDSPPKIESAPLGKSLESYMDRGSAVDKRFNQHKYKSGKSSPAEEPIDEPNENRKPYVPHHTDPMFNRFKYYQSLQTHAAHISKSASTEANIDDSNTKAVEENGYNTFGTVAPLTFDLRPPVHILPEESYIVHAPNWLSRISSSLAIIFSAWNTMVGSTILVMPSGFTESGLFPGVFVFVFLACISYYTCTLIVKRVNKKRKENLTYIEHRLEEQENEVVREENELESNEKNSINTGPVVYSDADGITDENNQEGTKLISSRYSSEDVNEKRNLVGSIKNIIKNKRQNEKKKETKPTPDGPIDFSDVCVEYLGPWSQYLALFVSCTILVGASIAYHIFMKDCLCGIVEGVFGLSISDGKWYWNNITSALVILIIPFPIIHLKKPSVLMRLNSFGILFVVFLISFIIYSCVKLTIDPTLALPVTPVVEKISEAVGNNTSGTTSFSLFGHNFDFNNRIGDYRTHKSQFNFVNRYGWISLMGILCLSFFVHNVISNIITESRGTNAALLIHKKRKKRHHLRDIFIAFVLASICYLIPGVFGAYAWRLAPEMNGNYLNMFKTNDIVANIARFSVLLQLLSIYPLLIFVIRVQSFSMIFKNPHPGFIPVFIINVICCTVSFLFAAFYPKVGAVLRYTGSFCGLFYLYLLPILVHLSAMRKEGDLKKDFKSAVVVIFHIFLICIGTGTLLLQFVPIEYLPQ